MHLRVMSLVDWHLEVFLYYKRKMLEYMIFQSYTPTFILEPVFLKLFINPLRRTFKEVVPQKV